MTIEDGLKQFLGTRLATNRIYSHRAPQPLPAPADDPYIVFYRITVDPEHTHSGPAPVVSRLFQFSVFHQQQSVTIDAADRLRRALDGYRGSMGTVPVYGCFWAGETYAFTPETTPPLHQVSIDVRVHYRDV